MDGRGHYEFFRCWSWLLIGGCQDGDYLLNSERVRGDLALPHQHNMLVREFLEHTEADTLCIIEDDHVFEQDILQRMRDKPANHCFDVVCATYVARRGTPLPVSWSMIDPRANDGYTVQFRFEEVERTGTQVYDGSGLGLVLIRRWLLEEMARGRDLAEVLWFYPDGMCSPDVPFYRNARRLGARVGVDRDNRIGHIGKKIWYFEDFERAMDRRKNEPDEGEEE